MESEDDHLEWLFHSDDESEEDLITECATNVRRVGIQVLPKAIQIL